MAFRRMALMFCAVWLALCPLALAADAVPEHAAFSLMQQQEGKTRALLIGMDHFVSRPSAYPSSQNNVQLMHDLLQTQAPETILIPETPVTDAQTLSALIQTAFGDSGPYDTNFLYLSTHGVYEPGQEPMLLLSDGTKETGLTPSQLEAAFEGIQGMKVLILDACNSGAFIGKGMSTPPKIIPFQGDDFKVLTSSGALEESWYWSSEGAQGAFYFTQALVQGMSASAGYPADRNRDGCITLSELYDYLLLNHAASTPQVYPQKDEAVLFRYDPDAPRPTGLNLAPVMDVTFSGTTLSRENRQITIEFIATRPIRVAYQVVYQRDGKWEFDKAQLIYDGAERFSAFGDQPGSIAPGRKLRTINLSELPEESHGYVLVQLVSIDGTQLTVHAGRVLCVPPETGAMNLTASVNGTPDAQSGSEMSIFIGHDFPCTLSVSIVDENEKVIHRITHRQSTRPMQIDPAGSVFYWDGLNKNGNPVPTGTYRVRAQAHMNESTITVLSYAFSIP